MTTSTRPIPSSARLARPVTDSGYTLELCALHDSVAATAKDHGRSVRQVIEHLSTLHFLLLDAGRVQAAWRQTGAFRESVLSAQERGIDEIGPGAEGL